MTTGWRVSSHEKLKYDGIFQSLQPVSGKLPGDKVKPVLVNSGLPRDVLGKIWELSDHDKDGQFDAEEFAVAMHLVYQSMEKKPLPAAIPADLIPPSHRTVMPHTPLGGVQVLPPLPTLNTGSSISSEHSSVAAVAATWSPSHPAVKPTAVACWIISPQFQMTSDQRFTMLDADKDGLVNGAEIRDVLLQSGLDQQTLASIWSLCDIKSNGFLNREQFALAQYLIEDKVARGRDPPASLSHDMIPPSLRGLSDASSSATTEVSADLLQIEAEIEEIKRKKIQLEGEKQQREADLRICSGEVQTLQKEYEVISSTTQQLERQRGEAQKKLDELEDQKSRFDAEIAELRDKCQAKQEEINDINQQLAQQDRTEQDQALELNRLKEEYTELHTEANRLEKQITTNTQALEQFKLDKTSLTNEVSQAKTYIEELTKLNEKIETALKQYQSLIDGEEDASEPDLSSLQDPSPRVTQTSNSSNRSTPSLTANINSSPFSRASPGLSGFDAFGNSELSVSADPFAFAKSEQKSDPFATSDPFTSQSAFETLEFGKDDPFAKDDPFKSDIFLNSHPFKESFASDDAFNANDLFCSPSNPTAVQKVQTDSLTRPKSTDPFTSTDSFASSQPTRSSSAVPSKFSNDSDVFDPFKSTTNDTSSITNSNDPFGFDPFASSKPAEDKKKPPPRPSLPRPRATSPSDGGKPLFNPDPFKMAASSQASKKGNRPKIPTPNSDPFSNADPFGGSDPFSGPSNGTALKSDDPFAANFADFGSGFDAPSSAGDLEWAKAESEKSEVERKKRLAEQEKADFEFALALSKAES
ncbi:epidermal growth factor receptor substrate 15-like 1 isoform X2 [Watersipora subatra]|uniref:epidermal growth factor receptor substrate 15-like 1 isoform X2 n=1 Tax=Watersipora subatra TaxID=2589382 RepID=UPI00355C0D15